MIWIALPFVVAVVAFVIVAAFSERQPNLRALGDMSSHWIAQHRVQGP
jgi:hypothetical protein